MRIRILVHVLLSWAVVRCLATPHLLMLLKHRSSLVNDFENRDVSSQMPSATNHLTQHTARDASASPQSSYTVTVTLPDSASNGSSPTSTPSIEEIESEVTPPFRRDFSSVASHAGEPAMQHDYMMKVPTERLLPGYQDGRKDVDCGGTYECVKKRLSDVSETGLDTPKCGGGYECIKERLLSVLESGLAGPKCGGGYGCIRKRFLDIFQPGSSDPKCGGGYECIKKRVLQKFQSGSPGPKCGGGYECIKKRLVSVLGSGSAVPKCGGGYECIRKRVLEVIQSTPKCGGGYECIKRRLVDDLPTIKGRKPST